MDDSQGTAGPLKMFGNWPDVDMQLVSDFRQYVGKPVKTSPSCMIRLHMDIPIEESEAETYAKYLANGQHKELYEAIIKKHPGDVSKSGAKALKAALGL